MGLFASARIDNAGPLTAQILSPVVSLPLALYPLALIAIAALIASQRAWWTALAMFFAWLPFEDLVRKFAGNDLRVYFIKDILLILALVRMAPMLRGFWRRPLDRAWLPLVLLLTIAVICALPAIVVDPRLPLIGLLVRFFFIGLLPVGVWLAQDRDRLERFFVPLAVLCVAVCGIGLAQTFFGPDFLNPSVVDEHLTNLVVVRGRTGESVTRPSGPFVDAGRFASMTTLSVVVGLCLYRIGRTRGAVAIGALTVGVAGLAAFASGGRTAVLVAAAFILGAFLAGRAGTRSSRVGPIALVALLVVGVLTAGGVVGALTATRLTFYGNTLNPFARDSEIQGRVAYYTEEAIDGVRQGGVIGRGTGVQSVGKQYLGDDAPASVTESGWGTLAVEWGVIGLAAWIWWTAVWLRLVIGAARARHDTPAAPFLPIVASFTIFVLIVQFSLGAQTFDNYITNSFFWLFSGIALGSRIVSRRDTPVRAPVPARAA